QALAAVLGRDYVLPDDIKQLAPLVLAHRLVLQPEARWQGTDPESVVQELLASVPVPVEQHGRRIFARPYTPGGLPQAVTRGRPAMRLHDIGLQLWTSLALVFALTTGGLFPWFLFYCLAGALVLSGLWAYHASRNVDCSATVDRAAATAGEVVELRLELEIPV